MLFFLQFTVRCEYFFFIFFFFFSIIHAQYFFLLGIPEMNWVVNDDRSTSYANAEENLFNYWNCIQWTCVLEVESAEWVIPLSSPYELSFWWCTLAFTSIEFLQQRGWILSNKLIPCDIFNCLLNWLKDWLKRALTLRRFVICFYCCIVTNHMYFRKRIN